MLIHYKVLGDEVECWTDLGKRIVIPMYEFLVLRRILESWQNDYCFQEEVNLPGWDV